MYRSLLDTIIKSEHDARQGSETVYAKLLDRGFSDADITEAIKKTHGSKSRMIHLYSESQDNGDPIIGVTYTGDHRDEEEFGLSVISKNLEVLSSEKLTEIYEVNGVRVFVVLESEQSSYRIEKSVADAYRRHTGPLNLISPITKAKSVAELREELKDLVVSLPRNRPALEIAYESFVLGNEMKLTQSVGEFRSGGALAMITDEPILLAVLEILFEDTVDTDSLRFKTSSNPFSCEGVFYDVNDLTYERISDLAASEQWIDDRMNDAAVSITELKASGNLWAIRPAHLKSVVSRPDLSEGDYYYINYNPRGSANIFGWFTVEELSLVASGSITRDIAR